MKMQAKVSFQSGVAVGLHFYQPALTNLGHRPQELFQQALASPCQPELYDF
jgi:hypothetical protein